MSRGRVTLRRWLTSWVARTYLTVGRRVPLGLNRKIALVLCRMLSRLVPRMRRVAMANLDLAYGDSLTPSEKERIYRGAVDNMALVAAEFPHLDRLARGSNITVEGAELLQPGQGYLGLGAHLGNWELGGPLIVTCTGRDVAGVVRPLDDPALNRAVDTLRTRCRLTTIPKENAGKQILELLKKGFLVGILADQSPRDNGVPVQFFGAPCWATVGPVMAAVRARVPVVPLSITRNDDGGYTLRFHPPLEMIRSGNLRNDLIANSQRCQDALEAMIRETPEQWLWFHRRWKERPRLDEEWKRKMARDE